MENAVKLFSEVHVAKSFQVDAKYYTLGGGGGHLYGGVWPQDWKIDPSAD